MTLAAIDGLRRSADRQLRLENTVLTTLQGLKVLDFGLYFAGPYASRLLADLGADVIKLEALDGDTLRPTTKPFNAAARGKRSIAVDLKSDAGREVAHRIAAHADVVTHNMRPGVAERLGMGYETIRGLNPEVIYAYAPGWGSSGPDAARAGSLPSSPDSSGCTTSRRVRATSRPRRRGTKTTGTGSSARPRSCSRSTHRARTGKGQYLEHPQLNATMLMGLHLMRAADGSVVGSMGLDHERRGVHPLDRLYRTADGWLCISARTDAEFAWLCGVPEFAELRDDARFVDGDARLVHRSDLEAALTRVFADRDDGQPGSTSSSAAQVACAVPAGPEWPSQFLADPEQVRLGRVERYEHPRWGAGVRHRGDDEDGRRGDGPREAGARDRSTHARGARRVRLQSERDRLAVRRGSGALTVTEPAERDTDGVADTNPLSGVVVLDLSTGIPGAYFSKLFADGGAEIILVEGPEGNALRRSVVDVGCAAR